LFLLLSFSGILSKTSLSKNSLKTKPSKNIVNDLELKAFNKLEPEVFKYLQQQVRAVPDFTGNVQKGPFVNINYRVYNTQLTGMKLSDPLHDISHKYGTSGGKHLLLISIQNLELDVTTQIFAQEAFLNSNPSIQITLYGCTIQVVLEFVFDDTSVTVSVAKNKNGSEAAVFHVGEFRINVTQSILSSFINDYIMVKNHKILGEINQKIAEKLQEKLNKVNKTVGLKDLVKLAEKTAVKKFGILGIDF